MAWLEEGKVQARNLVDQSVVLNGWSGIANQRLPFQQLQPVGFLRSLKLIMPPTTLTGVAGNGAVAKQPDAQLAAYRAINRFRFTIQGISPLYDVRGEDLYMLRYVRDGRPMGRDFGGEYLLSSPPTAPNLGAAVANYETSLVVGGGNGVLTWAIPIPITETILYRDLVAPIVDASGKQVATVIMDKEAEIGMITMANAALNVRPEVILNPAYSTTVNGAVLTTGTATASANLAVDLDKEIWDIPSSPADYPPPFYQSWLVTRQNAEFAVNGGTVDVKIPSAGVLLKALYLLYDTNDNLVDVSTTPTASVRFLWGATEVKIDETVQKNLAKCLRRYEQPAPQGLLVHDFQQPDGSITQAIQSGDLPNVTTQFRNLPGSVTTCRCVMVRLIGVQP